MEFATLTPSKIPSRPPIGSYLDDFDRVNPIRGRDAMDLTLLFGWID
jgi:hypothetical protein